HRLRQRHRVPQRARRARHGQRARQARARLQRDRQGPRRPGGRRALPERGEARGRRGVLSVALAAISATTLPGEGKIRLRWTYPPGSTAAGVRVMRAEGTHPLSPTDGVTVADALANTEAIDAGLADGTVYYYSLFPFSGSPRVYEIDRH